MKIVILDGYGLNPGDLSWDQIKKQGELIVYDRTLPDEVLKRAKGAQIILTNKTVLTETEINQLPELRYIGVLATGYNVVNIDAAHKKGIIVTNIPAYSTASVAQMVFAHILNITNRVGLHASEVKAGRWSSSKDFCFWDTPQIEIANKTIGLIGLGHTGMATARIALAFGMRVNALTSKKQNDLPDGITAVSKEDIFSKSDIVSLHCPLTIDTRKIVNETTLSLMKSAAILINTGRGPLIDEQALADALNSKMIYAAGLDVLSCEPPKADNPLLSARNCFITPHIAWATFEARERMMQIAAENIRNFLKGSPINVI
ncbi:MAG: D-2-hydroxyacid dehydrogenase [Bacteroidales bacterium]